MPTVPASEQEPNPVTTFSAPCQLTRWATSTAFINPHNCPPRELEQAMHLCETCPVLRKCARHALFSGSTIDDSVKAPALDVLQAGVICDGTKRTKAELARRAGIPVQKVVWRRSKPRVKVEGTPCKGCGLTLVRWQRRPDLAPGEVMHYARGYCTNCRGEYAREKAREAKRNERKQLAREVVRKHDAATAGSRKATA